MDSKLFMRGIARNRTVKYLVLASYVVTFSVFADQVQDKAKPLHKLSHKTQNVLPSFSTFNRSINQGSEISYAVSYKGKPTDKLIKGVLPPEEDGWETHSTFTTSLFLITKNKPQNLILMLKSDGGGKLRSKLLVNFRYFDANGLYLESNGWNVFDAPYEWKKVSVQVLPKNKNAVYAEAWFVKYRDADSTGKVNHPVYVSDVEVR